MRNILSPCNVINQDRKEKKRTKHGTFITFIFCLFDRQRFYINCLYGMKLIHCMLDCNKLQIVGGRVYVIFTWVNLAGRLKGHYYYKRA